MNPSRSYAHRIGTAFLVLLLTVIVMQTLAAAILPVLTPAFTQSDWYLWLLSSLPIYLCGLPLCLAVLRHAPAAPDRPNRPMRISHWFLSLIISFGMMFIGNLIGQALMWLVSALTGLSTENPLDRMILDMHPLIPALFTVIVAPIGEEFIFRRLVIDRARRFGEWQAVLLSGALFGAFHMNFFQFFYAFFLGLVFGYIYVKTGRLRYTIALHAAINFMGGVIAPVLVRKILPLLEGLENGLPALTDLLPILPALLIYFLYSFLLSGSAMATVVLGILLHRKISFASTGEDTRPLWLNFSIIAFFAVCAIFAVAGIFSGAL